MNTIVLISRTITNSASGIIIPIALITPSRIFAVGDKNPDLATHGTSDCYGEYNSTTQTGSGAGFVNSCMHSGETDHSSGATVWYNYAAASAGTIVNKDASDTTGNTNTATESVCPKGWTLPSMKQIDNNRSMAEFSPVRGGIYGNSTLITEDTRGNWWGSTAYDGAKRYSLYFNSSSLRTEYSSRYFGFYIRCVSEEKTVTDLTYIQKFCQILLVENF